LPVAGALRQRPFGNAKGAYTPPDFHGQGFFFVCRKKIQWSVSGRPPRRFPRPTSGLRRPDAAGTRLCSALLHAGLCLPARMTRMVMAEGIFLFVESLLDNTFIKMKSVCYIVYDVPL
jgi:hypothetical protein